MDAKNEASLMRLFYRLITDSGVNAWARENLPAVLNVPEAEQLRTAGANYNLGYNSVKMLLHVAQSIRQLVC